MQSSDAPVRLQGVGKFYNLNFHKPRDLKTAFLHPLRWAHYEPWWALRDIDLTVRRGESLAIIGPNGSGKSTLLRIIARIARPTAGTVDVNGRISALLELGAGFHGQITGRENAILNGVLLGLRHAESCAVLPEVIDFSELGDFIDQPMRTYSSGMFVRLGFAVAVHVKADVLLVDEVLAVGDAEFQKKCFAHIDALRAKGVTIIMVSHDMSAVQRFSDRTVLIEHGRMIADGHPKDVIKEYLARAESQAAMQS